MRFDPDSLVAHLKSTRAELVAWTPPTPEAAEERDQQVAEIDELIRTAPTSKEQR